MEPGLVLFSPSGAQALDPAVLAAQHPLLEQDVQDLAPWRQVDLPAAASDAPAWRSGRKAPALVLVCGHCPSSLDMAWRLVAGQLLAPWDSVLAVGQAQGRGQMRRAWHSPPGNVYAAVRLPETFSQQGDLAPYLAGCCLALALRNAGVPAEVKWPNDLLAAGRKVGGVLLEERGGVLLAGVGLNLASAPDAGTLERAPLAPLPGRLAVWQGLQGAGPLAVWLQLLRGMRQALGEFSALTADGLPAFLDGLLAWRGLRVLVQDSGTRHDIFDKSGGVVVGIGIDGALYLDEKGCRVPVRSGSIVLAGE